MGTPAWEPFCEEKSICKDDVQTTSAVSCPRCGPPTQQQPGLPARSSEQRRSCFPAAAASICPSALAALHGAAGITAGIIYCYFPPAAGARDGGSGVGTAPERRDGGTACGASLAGGRKNPLSPAPRSPCSTGRSQPYCTPQIFPAARPCRFGGAHGHPPMPGRAQHHPARGTPSSESSPSSRWIPDPQHPPGPALAAQGFSAALGLPGGAMVTGSALGDRATPDDSISRTRSGTKIPPKRSGAKGINLSSALAAK